MKLELKKSLFVISTLSFVVVCFYFSSMLNTNVLKYIASSWIVVSNNGNRTESGLIQWMTKMEQRYSQRAELVKSACEKYSINSPYMIKLQHNNYQKLMFDTYFKWGYCAVGKVASSTLADQFKKLMTTKERPHRFNGPLVDQWRREQMPKFFKLPGQLIQQSWTLKDDLIIVQKKNLIAFLHQNDYLLFTFVRHPFERLISAYKEKILKPHDYVEPNEKYGVLFKKRNSLSFPEFIDLVLKDHHSGETVNGHWDTYSKKCLHCTVPYDVIGQLETFNEDLKYIVLKLGLENILPIEDIEKWQENKSDYKTRNKKKEILQYFSQLTKSKFEELWKIYRLDFEMFGYDASDYLNSSVPNIFASQF